MIIKYCDRCGIKIEYCPEAQSILSTYFIRKYQGMYSMEIDLCDNCQKELAKFLAGGK